MLKSYFIGGLKSEVRHDVKLFRPSDVHEAIALAFQVDAKLADSNVRNFSKNSNSFSSNFPNHKSSPLLVSHRTSSSTNSKASNVRKMYFEELQYRRKKGLCYSCPKKWVRGHVCANQQLLLLDVLADRSVDMEVIDMEVTDCEDQEDQHVEITACAVYGISAPQHIQTMKVIGLIKIVL